MTGSGGLLQSPAGQGLFVLREPNDTSDQVTVGLGNKTPEHPEELAGGHFKSPEAIQGAALVASTLV